MPRRGTLSRERSDMHRSATIAPSKTKDSFRHNSLSAKTPVIKSPSRSRAKPTKNWLPLSMAGRKGLPAAACQTSCSEESMGQARAVLSFGKELGGDCVADVMGTSS